MTIQSLGFDPERGSPLQRSFLTSPGKFQGFTTLKSGTPKIGKFVMDLVCFTLSSCLPSPAKSCWGQRGRSARKSSFLEFADIDRNRRVGDKVWFCRCVEICARVSVFVRARVANRKSTNPLIDACNQCLELFPWHDMMAGNQTHERPAR